MVKTMAVVCGLVCMACSVSRQASPTQPVVGRSAGAAELFARGRRLAGGGDSVRAEQYLAAALRRGHDPRETLPLLMRVCLTGSRLRAALTHATPYLKKHPEAVWLRYLVATVYLGLGQSRTARRHLETIETYAPDHAPAQYLLGVTEWQGFGNREAARTHFESYLRLAPEGSHASEVDDWLRSNPRWVEVSSAAPVGGEMQRVNDGEAPSPPVATPAAIAPSP